MAKYSIKINETVTFHDATDLEKLSNEVLLLLEKEFFLACFNDDEFDSNSDTFLAIEKELLRRMKRWSISKIC